METLKTHICSYKFFSCTFTQNKNHNYTSGFLAPRIAYIKKGSCEVKTQKGSLFLHEGTTWYLPRLFPYSSYWIADPEVDFYTVEFETNSFGSNFNEMQSIDGLPLSKDFEKMHEAITENNECQALSSLYSIFAQLKPYLKKTNSDIPKEILSAVNYVTENYKTDFQVADLAKKFFISESRFYLLFKKATGFSPVDYKNYLKISHAVNDLLSGLTLEEICENYDIYSPSYFRRLLKKFTGKSPSQLKKYYDQL